MNSELSSFGNWILVKYLGRGSFGEVIYWRNRLTDQKIASKTLKIRNMRESQEKLIERWLQEKHFLYELKTKYIVGKVDIVDTEFIEYLTKMQYFDLRLPVLIMEYCDGGNLREHLQMVSNLNGMPEYKVQRILFCLKNALKYLHDECNIEHRDLKPENIVLKINKDGEHIYKLTDFGYARYLPEQTAEQSVVGTAYYMAPEIIDSGRYTRAVDYWSMGIIIFEIICGIRPFIPHSSLFSILQKTFAKPRNCIAITEEISFELSNSSQFQYHNCLFKENQCSQVFINYIEKWLHSTLDINYADRGKITNENGFKELIFYKSLDFISDLKIVKVFSLKSCDFSSYEINSYTNMNSFLKTLANDFQISQKNLLCILPQDHPKKQFEFTNYSTDLFVAEWYNSCSWLPKIMLYIVDISTNHINLQHAAISNTVQEFMQISADDIDLPNWVVDQFERHVLFLIEKAEQNLRIFINGLRAYINLLDKYLIHFKSKLSDTEKEIFQMMGRLKQFEMTVNECNGLNGFIQPNLIQFQNTRTKIEELEKHINYISRRCSLMQKVSQGTDENFFSTLYGTDAYQFNYFSHHLKEYSKYLTNSERIDIAQKVFDNYILERKRIPINDEVKKWLLYLNSTFLEYKMSVQSLNDLKVKLINVNYELNHQTTEFLQTFVISKKIKENVDEPKINTHQNISQLIEQSKQLIVMLNSTNLETNNA